MRSRWSLVPKITVCSLLVSSGFAQVRSPQPPVPLSQGPRVITDPRIKVISPAAAPVPDPPLRGFVDLHTHPMANLGFGGRLIYGGVDVGSLLPVDPACNHNVRAINEEQALGHDRSTHGGPVIRFDTGWVSFSNPSGTRDFNPCGNAIRGKLIHLLQGHLYATDPGEDSCGLPYPTDPTPDFCKDTNFSDWPAWKDLTHQKMWVEWIRRAYNGGLRVMVALAVNNKTLGDLITAGNQSGTPDLPTDDRSSADLQISELKGFVGRHSDFMEVAYGSADVNRIVSANKLAVIIGMEIDHIGNFGQVGYPAPSQAQVIAEIDRLYSNGVRYIFPIHLLDNAFGGTAAYEDLFNVSTTRESGHPWDLACADPGDSITYRSEIQNNDFLTFIKALGIEDPVLNALGLGSISGHSPYPVCAHKNRAGLTPLGFVAVQRMMSLGMLIDIDHMSQRAADEALALACYADPNKMHTGFSTAPLWGSPWGSPSLPCNFGYPLNSGHNGLRTAAAPDDDPSKPTTMSERNFRGDQYWLIGRLHGMAGVGSAKLDAPEWLTFYKAVIGKMRGNVPESTAPDIVAAFGTDADGMEFQMPARDARRGRPGWFPTIAPPSVQYGSAFPQSRDGNRAWDYNKEGVAHYGMLWDFLQDMRSFAGGADVVDNNLMWGASYFFNTWQKAETLSPWAQTIWFLNGPPLPTGAPATVVTSPPAITSAPANNVVGLGQSARFAVTASGAAPLGYQWRRNGAIIGGATSPTYVAPPVTPSDLGAQFAVVVSNSVGSVTSSAATITGLLFAKVSSTWPAEPVTDTVTVASGNTAMAGVTVSSGNSTYVTNASGVVVITHAGCFTGPVAKVGDTTAPKRTPVPCRWSATASKAGYQTVSVSLP